MLNIDLFVDALEEEIAKKGVLAVDLRRLAPNVEAGDTGLERSGILVEMLRVWMEHRWQAGYPVSVANCLNVFPTDTFSEAELNCLRFEENRLNQNADCTGSGALSGSGASSGRSINDLPNPGEAWGDFELLSILGTGAFAKVYLARQRGLSDRLVALKLTFRQNHESQWLATLQHSAIVPIYSTHFEDGVYAICMPFLGNTTLVDLLQGVPPETSNPKLHWLKPTLRKNRVGGHAMLSTIQQRHGEIETILKTDTKQSVFPSRFVDQERSSVEPSISSGLPKDTPTSRNLNQCDYVEAICWIGSQLADALAYAHRNGVVHSDVKPANVLIAFDGQPRLLDFNVSYQRSPEAFLEATSPMGGTIAYMSPEHRQAFEKPTVVDARSDVFSIGVVLFEMLTGRLPNRNDGIPEAPSRWNSSVSPAMSAIVRKCLAIEPGARYQSADALRDDLIAQYLHEPLVHQSEPSVLERISKWCHRHPRLSSSISIASAATILVALLLSGIVARQAALNQADWVHRVDMLRQRIPGSMAMLTSLDAFPELENQVLSDLETTFALMSMPSVSPAKTDPRWTSLNAVDRSLRSEVCQLAWIANQRSWTKSPTIPRDLAYAELLQDDRSRLDPITLRKERNFGAAIQVLKQQVELNPQDYVGWWLLGDCYLATKDLPNAMQAYTVCIALQPKDALPYLNRGVARFQASMYEGAAEDFRTTWILSPSWQWCHLNRALALQMLGKIDEAITELDEAIHADYESVSVFRLRGELYAAKGDLPSAQSDYDRALRCDPKTDQHWIDRGLILLGINPQLAAESFENAVEISPSSIDAHQKLAYVYSELLAKPEKGLEHSSLLVELAPHEPTHLAGRAVLHARSDRGNEALEDLHRLEQMQFDDPMVMYQAACGYSILASNTSVDSNHPYAKAALKWFTKAVSRDPNIATLAMSDPDVKWMRDQSTFHEIVTAIQYLHVEKH